MTTCMFDYDKSKYVNSAGAFFICPACYYYPCISAESCDASLSEEKNCYNNFGYDKNLHNVKSCSRLLVMTDYNTKRSIATSDIPLFCMIFNRYNNRNSNSYAFSRGYGAITSATNTFTTFTSTNTKFNTFTKEITITNTVSTPQNIYKTVINTAKPVVNNVTKVLTNTLTNSITKTNALTQTVCPNVTKLEKKFTMPLLLTKTKNACYNVVTTKMFNHNVTKTVNNTVCATKTTNFTSNNNNKNKYFNMLQNSRLLKCLEQKNYTTNLVEKINIQTTQATTSNNLLQTIQQTAVITGIASGGAFITGLALFLIKSLLTK